jgi:hypothetical protein
MIGVSFRSTVETQTGDDAGKSIVSLRFSIRTYMLAVVFVAEIVSLYKLIPWAIRTYHP